jgi:hypothetical protein
LIYIPSTYPTRGHTKGLAKGLAKMGSKYDVVSETYELFFFLLEEYISINEISADALEIQAFNTYILFSDIYNRHNDIGQRGGERAYCIPTKKFCSGKIGPPQNLTQIDYYTFTLSILTNKNA